MRWLFIILLIPFGKVVFAQTTYAKVKISRFNTNQIASVNLPKPADLSGFELFLLDNRQLDTLAYYRTFFPSGCDSIESIKFSKDYFIIVRDDKTIPGLYSEASNYSKTSKTGYWVINLQLTNGTTASYNRRGPLIWERKSLKYNPIPNLNEPPIEARYEGSISAGIEYGANAFEMSQAPILQSYTRGEHKLELLKTPVVLSYQVHSANSEQRPLNYFRVDLNTDKIQNQLRQEYTQKYLENIDSFNLQELAQEKIRSQLTSTKFSLKNRLSTLQDSLTYISHTYQDSLRYLNQAYEDSLHSGTLSKIDSTQLVREKEKYESIYKQKVTDIENKEKEFRQQIHYVENKIEASNSQIDSLKGLSNKYNELLMNRPENVIEQSADLKKAHLMKKVAQNLDDFKLGRHVISAGNLGGAMSIRGATISYKLKKLSIAISQGKTVLPINDSFLNPTIYAKNNALLKLGYSSGNLEIGAIQYLGTNSFTDDSKYIKPLSSIYFRLKEGPIAIDAEASNSRESLNAQKFDWNNGLRNLNPMAISALINIDLLGNRLKFQWQNNWVSKTYRGIGYFQSYTGYQDYRAGIAFNILSNKVSGKGFLQLFLDENQPDNGRNQIGVELDLRPLRTLRFNVNYLPNQTGLQWFDRRAIFRQRFLQVSSNLNIDFNQIRVLQTIGYQSFNSFGEFPQLNRNFNTSHSLFVKNINAQHNFVFNYSDSDISFTANQLSIGIMNVFGFIGISSSLMSQNSTQGNSRRLSTNMDFNLHGWNFNCSYSWFNQSLGNEQRPPINWNCTLTKTLRSNYKVNTRRK